MREAKFPRRFVFFFSTVGPTLAPGGKILLLSSSVFFFLYIDTIVSYYADVHAYLISCHQPTTLTIFRKDVIMLFILIFSFINDTKLGFVTFERVF